MNAIHSTTTEALPPAPPSSPSTQTEYDDDFVLDTQEEVGVSGDNTSRCAQVTQEEGSQTIPNPASPTGFSPLQQFRARLSTFSYSTDPVGTLAGTPSRENSEDESLGPSEAQFDINISDGRTVRHFTIRPSMTMATLFESYRRALRRKVSSNQFASDVSWPIC